MFAILGSGFGLYGYLPALVSLGERVVLPERYRHRFNSRPELARFALAVEWAPTELEALDWAVGVVLAVRPGDQCEWVPHCLARRQIARLLLEKPLAPTPAAAALLLEKLVHSHKLFQVGYTFRYTDWVRHLRDALVTTTSAVLSIYWSFLAHHFRHGLHNWKRCGTTGGGAIRFFGIHVIALLAELGYDDVVFSAGSGSEPDEIERWMAIFSGDNLPLCNVVVDTRASSSNFRIALGPGTAQEYVLVDRQEPFLAYGSDLCGLDHRVKVLQQLCRSLCEGETINDAWQAATIKLWQKTELKNQFEKIGRSMQFGKSGIDTP